MGSNARVITRTRPSFTCVPCKQKKVKCEKQKPICAQCSRTETACFYDNIPPFDSQCSRTDIACFYNSASPFDTIGPDQASKRQRTRVDHAATAEEEEILQQPNPALVSHSQMPLVAGGGHPTREGTLGEPCALDAAFAAFLDSNGDIASYPWEDQNSFYITPDLPYTSAALEYDTNNNLDQSTTASPSHQHDEDEDLIKTPAAVQDLGAELDSFDGWDIMGTMESNEKASNPWTFVPKQYQDHPMITGYLSKDPHDFVRYVEGPLWAMWTSSQNASSSLILQRHLSQYHTKQFQERQQLELYALMRSLPPKETCDVLLRAFLLGVSPLVHLVPASALQARYDLFWTRIANCRSSSTQASSINVGSEKSFCCLLWSVLFCGAVAASPALLAEASLRINQRAALLSRLRSKVDKALEICCEDKLPTLDGLVASLLAQECDLNVDQIIDMPPFISQSIQAARTLGLHREAALSAMPGHEAEIGRRVWYHLVNLEVLTFIQSGSSLRLSKSELSYDTRPPEKHVALAMMAGSQQPRTQGFESSVTSDTSSAMILATGQHQMALVLRGIIEMCYSSSRIPERGDLERLASDITTFGRNIDVLVNKLTVRGVPERGRISSQLLGANPLVHGQLYLDNPLEPTVLNAFCRIRLDMMKYNVSILFNRQFLDQAPHGQFPDLWNRQVSNCVESLRNYLHLARLQAFAPYRWFCPGKLNASQECMIILSYLQGPLGVGKARQQLLYLLSEIFDMFHMYMAEADHGTEFSETTNSPDLKFPRRATWQAMKQLFDKISGKIEMSGSLAGQWPLPNGEPGNVEETDCGRPRMNVGHAGVTTTDAFRNDSQRNFSDTSNIYAIGSGDRDRVNIHQHDRFDMSRNVPALTSFDETSPVSADYAASVMQSQRKTTEQGRHVMSQEWIDIIEPR